MRATASGAITFLSLSALLAVAHGCGSQASDVCELVCECEHCNDVDEELLCNQLETGADVAEAYACDAEWEAYATCVEDKGKCDEKEARFSTEEPGRCNATEPIGVPCVDQAECSQFGSNLTCDGGQCVGRVCSGEGGFFCASDSDCPGGEDRCGDKLSDLNECESKASAHGGGDEPPSPEPGSGG
jgi:hypothetical protein